ncbi:hypothetical protein [Scytonema sp. NUACC26]
MASILTLPSKESTSLLVQRSRQDLIACFSSDHLTSNQFYLFYNWI